MLANQLLLKHKQSRKEDEDSEGNIKRMKPPKPEDIALDKKKQSKFTRKVKNVNKDIKRSKTQIDDNVSKRKKLTSGIVYLGHIPHGFYEKQIRDYFSQFGVVQSVVVCRSRRTGKSKGAAFVKFLHAEVAKIAAETMNNYLMFKRRLVAKFIPTHKLNKALFYLRINPNNPPVVKNRRRTNNKKNAIITEEKHIQKSKENLSKLLKKLQKLKGLGIRYNLKPVNVPKELENKLSNVTVEINVKSVQKNKEKLKNEEKPETVKQKTKKNSNKIIKKNLSKVTKQNKKIKSNLIKLASKELLRDKDHVIITRSSSLKNKNKKNQ